MDLKSKSHAITHAALRLAHDEMRAELVRATMEPGPIGEAAMRVADLCLPHFETEERIVFPAFALLEDLALGAVRPEMAEFLPLISAFSAQREAMAHQHHLILSAVAQLRQAAHREEIREYAEFAYGLTVHEKIEDEVIFPTLILIGRNIRQNLGMPPT